MVEFVKGHIQGAAISAALTISALSLVTPAFFDFFFDMIMVGLIWVVAKTRKPKL